jgi:signal transduction histidine kinase
MLAAWRVWGLVHAPQQAATAAAVEAASQRDRLLSSAIAAARRTAGVALNRAGTAAPASIPPLSDLLSGQNVEQSLLVLAGDSLLAAAGPHRLPPALGERPFTLVLTPFVRVLVVRETRGARSAQVGLLLDHVAGVPVAGPSLAHSVSARPDLSWQWLVSDSTLGYEVASSAVTAVRAMMQPIVAPPTAALAGATVRVTWLVGGGIFLLCVVMLFASRDPATRAGTLLLALWSIVRIGLVPAALGAAAMWSLLAACGLLLLGIILWRRPRPRSPIGLVAAVLLLATAPPLVLRAAEAIVPLAEVDSFFIWFGWQSVLALAAAAMLTVATAPLRTSDDHHASSRWGLIAAGSALALGVLGIVAWTPSPDWVGWETPLLPGVWASWYRPLWLLPLAAFLPRTTPRARLLAIAVTGGTLAALATWSTSLDRRIALATEDLNRLAAGRDSVSIAALDHFAVAAKEAHATRLNRLYAAWRGSELARARVPVHLALWSRSGEARESVALDSLNLSWDDLRPLVQGGDTLPRRSGLARDVGHHEVLVLPLAPDTIATVTIGPRSRVVAPSRFGRVVGWRNPTEPSYSLAVRDDNRDSAGVGFRRAGRFLRAERRVAAGSAPRLVVATIEMASQRPFAVRAALVVLLDAMLFVLLWIGLQRVLGQDPALATSFWRQSYRRTLAFTLTGFFVVPASLFTLYSVLRLRSEATRERVAVVATTLKDVEVAGGFELAARVAPLRDSLAVIADSVDAELAIYRNGKLVTASASLLPELGLLPPVVDPTLRSLPGAEVTALASGLPSSNLRIGAAAVSPAPKGTLIAAALPGRDSELAREQLDLALLLLLTSLGGTLAAIAVAGFVARALGKPIGVLQRTALAIGRGEAPPVVGDVPAEFAPVFGAIRQMEIDLRSSETELEAGRTRTAAILATVATGVIGVDAAGDVIQANPRAEQLLGNAIAVSRPLAQQLPASWRELSDAVGRLLESPARAAESRELEVGERRLAVTLAPLDDGGVVVAITDITEASRAARIVAWGEMARQVAHEIKNPLTPMRLGLQHLRRIRADDDPEFPRLVDETAERLLEEIERLDRIARSFARYGEPPEESRLPLNAVAVRGVIAELTSLLELGGRGLGVRVEGGAESTFLARREELLQVFLNLVDNAREAGATEVTFRLEPGLLRVEDNGRGIPPDQLQRIFEPSFSTTTSGTGLGLAIVRRLVEGWGGSITAESWVGAGAAFIIRSGSTPRGTPA